MEEKQITPQTIQTRNGHIEILPPSRRTEKGEKEGFNQYLAKLLLKDKMEATKG